MRLPRPRSLAGQLFAMQVVLVTLMVAGAAIFMYVTAHDRAEEAAARQAESTARSVAAAPGVAEAITGGGTPSGVLQPYTERARRDTAVTFITIMAPDGTRYTHPNPDVIGEAFLGHTARALRGETFTETYTGTLGPSLRVVTPVRADDGRIVGLVSAGITVKTISDEVRRQLMPVLYVAAGALALAGLATYLINARLRRHTHGMNAGELSRLHDYHQATLHAVREGLLMLDGTGRIALVNDGARELLGMGPGGEVVGRPVADLGLPAPLTEALLSPGPRVDEVHLTRDRTVVVNTSPVTGGEHRGTVVTLRDVTELQTLTGELDSARGFAEALRSQAHESANRLHAVVSLIELGRTEQAVEFATAELELAQTLTDRVTGAVTEPVLAALLLGKAAQANEQGVELVLSPDSRIDDGVLPPTLPPRDLVTVLGNLIDNAVDAAAEGARTRTASGTRDTAQPQVRVTALAADGELLLRVADDGPGVDPSRAEEVFARGWTTKRAGPAGRGLGLALVRQAARRHGGEATLTGAEAGGAEFTVRLPLGPLGAPAPETGWPQKGTAKAAAEPLSGPGPEAGDPRGGPAPGAGAAPGEPVTAAPAAGGGPAAETAAQPRDPADGGSAASAPRVPAARNPADDGPRRHRPTGPAGSPTAPRSPVPGTPTAQPDPGGSASGPHRPACPSTPTAPARPANPPDSPARSAPRTRAGHPCPRRPADADRPGDR
ncbi:histidine kinase [Streptomyces sp. CNQ-509]|uniref:sensor histidine kinase n=1 Tax=Streptomyces sp. CNQ-509 TaxID=444103 RepID=UPI00062DFFD7|nr:sensor histidine kinase [Streptomyces sp. CNQ-509]AKH84952.1 histidine kinase [Streptomyces sp. CNQ-509]